MRRNLAVFVVSILLVWVSSREIEYEPAACEVVTPTGTTEHPEPEEIVGNTPQGLVVPETVSLRNKKHTMAEFWVITLIIGFVFGVLFNE